MDNTFNLMHAYLLVQDFTKCLRTVDDDIMVPADPQLEEFAIHATPFTENRWCSWRQADADTDKRPSSRPWHLIQTAVSAEPC